MSIRDVISKFATEMAAVSPVRNPIEVHLPPATYRALLGECEDLTNGTWINSPGKPFPGYAIYLHTEAGLVLVSKIEGYTEELTP